MIHDLWDSWQFCYMGVLWRGMISFCQSCVVEEASDIVAVFESHLTKVLLCGLVQGSVDCSRSQRNRSDNWAHNL